MASGKTYQNMNLEQNECYTTSCEADKLVEFIIQNDWVKKDSVIWLPFDTELSRIYLSLKDNGFTNLILSSLTDGKDFYAYKPNEFDIIISNPPFSGRTKLFDRLFSFDKPFIVLQGTQAFNNQFFINHLCDKTNDITFLLPRSRMSFMVYDKELDIVKSTKSGASFYSFWVCYKIENAGGGSFVSLKDNGREKEIEKMDLNGNPIEDNYISLFNWKDKKIIRKGEE